MWRRVLESWGGQSQVGVIREVPIGEGGGFEVILLSTGHHEHPYLNWERM